MGEWTISETAITESQRVRLRRYDWALAALWTAFVATVVTWNLLQQRREVLETARHNARAAFEKDVANRRWAAEHGGVYVPASEQTPPNPYLARVEERDITTPSGRTLTLLNPAYMTRQVHELGAELYGFRGHITSLNPIRTENAPDPWETLSITHKSHDCTARFHPSVRSASLFHPLHRVIVPGGPSLLRAR